MIKVLDDFKKIVQFLKKFPISKRPNSKYNINVTSSLADSLVIGKSRFTSCIAGIVEPFLKQFQTDEPMIRLLFFEMNTIIAPLLQIIVQLDIIQSCKSTRSRKEIDLSDKIKLFFVDKIYNGFSIDVVVYRLKRSDSITSSQIKEFKKVSSCLPSQCCENYFRRVHRTGAQIGGEASPALFWKSRKTALILEKKGPDCVHPYVKFAL